MNIYGLIGYPLTHSFSAQFFNNKFINEKIEAEYLNFEIKDILELRRVILFNPHLRGLNVTIPYKESVLPFLNNLSTEAERIGAVNVIKIDRKPDDMYFFKLTGYNTDYIGFRDSILPFIRSDIHKKALILGTGGASKAVAYALADINIDYVYVSRSKKEKCITYDEISPELMNDYKVIINASPVGTFPQVDNCPTIPYDLLTEDHLLYDLVYNPEETLFLKQGRERGAATKNGKEMLELQAITAWNIWNDI